MSVKKRELIQLNLNTLAVVVLLPIGCQMEIDLGRFNTTEKLLLAEKCSCGQCTPAQQTKVAAGHVTTTTITSSSNCCGQTVDFP